MYDFEKKKEEKKKLFDVISSQANGHQGEDIVAQRNKHLSWAKFHHRFFFYKSLQIGSLINTSEVFSDPNGTFSFNMG